MRTACTGIRLRDVSRAFLLNQFGGLCPVAMVVQCVGGDMFASGAAVLENTQV